jgi:hypothetical protein
VFDGHFQPISGLTVFLVDDSKTYQQEFGFAYTDADGYFLLNYAGPGPATQDKSAKAAPLPNLFVGIANAKSEPVHLESNQYSPIVGGATYLNVVLPSGNVALGEPPKQIRDVAVPPKRKRGK